MIDDWNLFLFSFLFDSNKAKINTAAINENENVINSQSRSDSEENVSNNSKTGSVANLQNGGNGKDGNKDDYKVNQFVEFFRLFSLLLSLNFQV